MPKIKTKNFIFSFLELKQYSYSKYYYNFFKYDLIERNNQVSRSFSAFFFKNIWGGSQFSFLYYFNTRKFFYCFMKLLMFGLKFITISSSQFLNKAFFIFNFKKFNFTNFNNFFQFNDFFLLKTKTLIRVNVLFKQYKIRIMLIFDYYFLFRIASFFTKRGFYIFSSVPSNYKAQWIDFPLLTPIFQSNFHLAFASFQILLKIY